MNLSLIIDNIEPSKLKILFELTRIRTYLSVVFTENLSMFSFSLIIKIQNRKNL